jgi:hypothetical protein
MRTRNFFAALITALACTLANAAEPPEGWNLPTVAHDGVRVVGAGGQAVETRFHYLPPGLQREDMSQEGMSMAMIIRQDLGVVWTVLPGGMYMEMSIDDAGEDTHSLPGSEGVVEFEALGAEEMNGWPTTRYRVVSMEDGKRAEGEFWVTEHWIPVRMEIAPSDRPGDKVTMNVRDLQVRDQDPALFELPPGATKLAGLGGLTGDAEGGFGFPAELAEEATEQAQETTREETTDIVKDSVSKGLKKLFGR